MPFDDRFLQTLESLVLLARRLRTGERAGERPSPRDGASSEFRDYRSYVEGDDLRSVDWNVYARHEQLHVKRFAAERDLHAWVAVDVSDSMGFFGKREQALAVAAAVGYVALARGDTLSWGAFAERRVAGGEGLRGKGAGIGYLKALEGAPAGGKTDLRAAAPPPGASRGLAIVISDFCDRGAREALHALRPRGGNVVAIHVVADEELKPGLSGPLRLVDAETGRELDVDADEGMLAAYREALTGRWDALQAFCAREGMPYRRILARAPLLDAVAALLKPGGALARR